MRVTRLDSAQSLFFARQLEHIKKTVYNKIYAQLEMRRIVPAAIDPAPFGTKLITFRSYDRVGMADLIASYADDLPNVALTASETSVEVAEYGNSVQWSFFEIAAAALAGLPLKQALMMNARDIMEEQFDRCVAYGDSRKGLTGFFNNANVPTSSVATVSAATTWAAKKALGATGMDAIYDDVMSTFDGMTTLTKGVETPDTLVVPYAQARVLSRPRNDQGQLTVLQMLQNSIPGLTVIPSIRAAAANSEGAIAGDTMVLYKRDPTKLSYEEPLPFTPMPPQERNLANVVNNVMSCGGTQFMFPLSAAYRTGI